MPEKNAAVSKECRLTKDFDQGYQIALDLEVSASPLKESENSYILFMIRDISEEKRKQIYERSFLHDLINTSGAVKGILERLKETNNPSEVQEMHLYAQEGINLLIEEIQFHKELIAAEQGQLALKIKEFSVRALVKRVAGFFLKEAAHTCEIRIKMPDKDITAVSDPILVSRVLINMIKNGIEAAGENDIVSIGWDEKKGLIEFWVNNPQEIPREVQLQIFQRSFSTKGIGRGIGTYSMKLLGEKYLGGHVNFTCAPNHGTKFYFQLPLKR